MVKENIGIEVKAPEKTCNDKHCPFHGEFSVRGRTFTGKIIGHIFHKSATIEWERRKFVKKYERYEKRRTRVRAHVTPCMDVKTGDNVMIMESRPISKTKKFVVLQKID